MLPMWPLSELCKQIESEERLAAPEEQEILSRYVGWGGLADCFDEAPQQVCGAESVAFTEEEYAAARGQFPYRLLHLSRGHHRGLSTRRLRRWVSGSGNLLVASCGVGNFIGMLPDSMAASKVYGVELDCICGQVARQLYQNSRIAVHRL